MFRSNPVIDRIIQFFTLHSIYSEVTKFKECKKYRLDIVLDLMELFSSYKTFPDNYHKCRLWEVEKSKWKYYYGSNYQSYQRSRLRRNVQRDEYQILFTDKAVCEQLCKGIGVRLPHIYGIIRTDHNYKEKILSLFQNSTKDLFIIKPLLGSGGRGIVLAKKINNDIFIQSQNSLTPLNDFELMENAIVQEVIKQDTRLSVFSSSSVNTVRVVTMYTKKESIIIVSALMRCGVGESYVDNHSAGGVAVGIDCKTGKLMKYAGDGKRNRYAAHPTSGVVFEGFVVPEWERICDAAVVIQRAFPYYCLLGMDIALDQSCEPVLLEVNAHPDLVFMEQTSGPLLQNIQNLQAFGEYDLLVNKHQKELYRNLVVNGKINED